jgi:hypothetical protein
VTKHEYKLRMCLEALARGETVYYVALSEAEAERFFAEVKRVAENAPPPFSLSNLMTKVL